jgi:hypothetical protein
MFKVGETEIVGCKKFSADFGGFLKKYDALGGKRGLYWICASHSS